LTGWLKKTKNGHSCPKQENKRNAEDAKIAEEKNAKTKSPRASVIW
jgi:hypothetical protein